MPMVVNEPNLGSATMYAAMMASTIAAVRNTPATAIHVMRLDTLSMALCVARLAA
jgi:hypothetical protein